jgi:hypothetical protein
MYRWAVCCNAVMLACEVGIITATFIFLRDGLAWRKAMRESGSPEHYKMELSMLILSIITTASVIFLSILGSGNIMRGLKSAWMGARHVSKIAPSIIAPSMRKDRTFTILQNMEEIDSAAASV